jgi:hypothetical protein
VLGQTPARDRDLLARVGFVAQDAPLYGDFTGAELLRLVISRGVYSAQGVKLTPGSGSQALCDQATAARCVAEYGAGAYNQELFQPADRFWLFQGIETALFVALALALVLVAVRLVRRRLA